MHFSHLADNEWRLLIASLQLDQRFGKCWHYLSIAQLKSWNEVRLQAYRHSRHPSMWILDKDLPLVVAALKSIAKFRQWLQSCWYPWLRCGSIFPSLYWQRLDLTAEKWNILATIHLHTHLILSSTCCNDFSIASVLPSSKASGAKYRMIAMVLTVFLVGLK